MLPWGGGEHARWVRASRRLDRELRHLRSLEGMSVLGHRIQCRLMGNFLFKLRGFLFPGTRPWATWQRLGLQTPVRSGPAGLGPRLAARSPGV